MANISMTMTDMPDGGMDFHIYGDDFATSKTIETNTPAQNLLIFILLRMEEIGFEFPVDILALIDDGIRCDNEVKANGESDE